MKKKNILILSNSFNCRGCDCWGSVELMFVLCLIYMMFYVTIQKTTR